jgi:hypothetical protein
MLFADDVVLVDDSQWDRGQWEVRAFETNLEIKRFQT